MHPFENAKDQKTFTIHSILFIKADSLVRYSITVYKWLHIWILYLKKTNLL